MASSTTALQRPTFFEGQVISSADLNALVDTGRIGLAQHERYLHSPGIAFGLELAGTERTTIAGEAYQDIVVSSGLAIDGNGRHITLIESERLSEDGFDQANVAISDAKAWYPVFLSGRDEAVSGNTASSASCFGGAPSRLGEIAVIGFGRVEQAADFGNVATGDVAAGPESSGAAWRILLGFVQWNAAIGRFANVAPTNAGIGRSYAGARADSVVARGGSLTLRVAEQTVNGKPAVEIVPDAGGELRFGLQNNAGRIVPVFTVNANGDLFAAGKISGAIGGGAQYQSGAAFDGTLLPLPPGITAEQVVQGKVTVQAHVTPRYGVPALPVLAGPHRWLMTPIECRIDADRRVRCRVRWTRTDTNAIEELPGLCDFTLVANVGA